MGYFIGTGGQQLDEENPINWAHPLNRGLVTAFRPSLGSFFGGPTLRDLCFVRNVRNNGVLTNGPTWVGAGHSASDAGLSLDGSNDLVSFGSNGLTSLTEATFSVWFKPRATRQFGGIVVCNAVGLIETKSTRYGVLVPDSTNVNAENSGAITYNVWQHVVAIRSQSSATNLYNNVGANWCGIYINGVPSHTTFVSDTGYSLSGRYDLGRGFGGNAYNIEIGEVGIYNRALSPSDEAGLYQDVVTGAKQTVNWLPRRVYSFAAPTGDYTLTASHGSLTLSGQSAGLLAGRKLTAANGSFANTGQTVGLVAGRKLTAAQGSLALSGQSAGLTVGRRLICAHGSFSLAGQSATLTYQPNGSYTLTAAHGTFTLTGQAAGLRVARRLACVNGSYTMTGQTVGLVYSGDIPEAIDRADFSMQQRSAGFTLQQRTAACALAQRSAEFTLQ